MSEHRMARTSYHGHHARFFFLSARSSSNNGNSRHPLSSLYTPTFEFSSSPIDAHFFAFFSSLSPLLSSLSTSCCLFAVCEMYLHTCCNDDDEFLSEFTSIPGITRRDFRFFSARRRRREQVLLQSWMILMKRVSWSTKCPT